MFRPWQCGQPEWKTYGSWYHVDQNPRILANLACYQGLVSLYPQNEYTGGTVVIPNTHQMFQQVNLRATKKTKKKTETPNKHTTKNIKKLKKNNVFSKGCISTFHNLRRPFYFNSTKSLVY